VKFVGAASANVMAEKGAVTEGVVYRLRHADEIAIMDTYEGYPLRYDRLPLTVVCGDDVIDAWVYVATPAYIDESLKPARWYLQHLLAGKAFLSNEYIEQLLTTDCLPDTDLEPE